LRKRWFRPNSDPRQLKAWRSPDNPQVAVSLRPGTEIAFDSNVQTAGQLFRKDIGERLVRFRQIDLNQTTHHHDALEFSTAQSF
jgi:hypothetical protein